MTRKTYYLPLVLVWLILVADADGQSKLFRPYTKWYQDPLGIKPLELSTATGFVWASAAAIASIRFTKKDSLVKRRFAIFQETGIGFAYKPPYTTAIQGEVGLLYNVKQWLSVGAGINVFHFSDKTNNTVAYGFRPLVRWHLLKKKNAGLFFEYGAGVSYSMQQFPLTGTELGIDTARTGTRFNLFSRYGIGAQVRVSRRYLLEAGARHFHLSNGNLKGVQRNPSHDSNGFFIGIVYAR